MIRLWIILAFVFPFTFAGSWIFVGSSAVEYSPTDITNLKMWLRPDQALTKDGSNLVEQWDSTSGSLSISYTETNATFKPLYIADCGVNAQPCVQFNDDRLTAGTTQVLNQSTAHTILFVYKRDGTSSSYEAIFGFEDNVGAVGTAAAILYRSGTTAMEMLFQSGVGWSPHYYSLSPGTTNAYVFEFSYTGSTPGDLASFATRIDNVTQTHLTKAGGSFAKTIIGNWNNTGTTSATAAVGRLFELIIYEKILTADDRDKIVQYFNARYGFSMTP